MRNLRLYPITIIGDKSMSEPVMAGTGPVIQMGAKRPSAFHRGVLRTAALSLIGVLSATAVMLPVQAAQSADTVYSIQSTKAQHGLMLDVAQAGARLVAVGDRGHILYSDDQGQNWTQAKVPTRQLLTAVYFVDATHGWAVGHDAQILMSSPGSGFCVLGFWLLVLGSGSS